MNPAEPLHLFEAYGVELEYMIVSRSDLAVVPLSDLVLKAEAGSICNEVEVGPLCWSNELVMHVIEQKTNGPAARLQGLAAEFQLGVKKINQHLEKFDACLLPGGMHPWMNPLTDTKLWPHDYSEIYASYNRIFSCQGHGWSNLQSTHINLPFCGDDEFGRLHAAIRLILPLLPALAASSPIMEGHFTGLLDYRLRAYQQNQRKIPQITGNLVPEAVFTAADYEAQILQPMYAAVAPFDPDAILQDEWLNSRGAIARFERNAIEIRLLDIQECPAADLAIIEFVCAILKALVREELCDYQAQKVWDTTVLAKWLAAAVGDAEQTMIADPAFLGLFGYSGKRASMQQLLGHLAEQLCPQLIADKDAPLAVILSKGPLARRILKQTSLAPTRQKLKAVYRQLRECLAEGQMLL